MLPVKVTETEIKSADMASGIGAIQNGLKNVMANPQTSKRAIESLSKVTKALNDGADIRGPLGELLSLDPEWDAVAKKHGFGPPEEVSIVCGGLCIFLAGFAAGVVAGAAVS